MDIRGLGDANIRKFYEMGYLQNVTSIYSLPYASIAQLDGFGAKSIEKMQQAIEASKQQDLARLIFALGIRYVGETTAKTLARSIENLQDLATKTVEDFLLLEDVGTKVAHSIVHFFAQQSNVDLLFALEQIGINMKNTVKAAAAEGGLSGKTFLFTGTLSQLKRSEAEAMVEAKGGQIIGGVSAKLQYLVVGEDAGSKLEKAKKLGSIVILSEQEFLNLLQ
jgi:DNA ligase (NAD+)